MSFHKGEKVALNLDDLGNFVPAIVTEVVSEGQYFVTAFPGPNKDGESLTSASSEVGPIGEGKVRYGISKLVVK